MTKNKPTAIYEYGHLMIPSNGAIVNSGHKSILFRMRESVNRGVTFNLTTKRLADGKVHRRRAKLSWSTINGVLEREKDTCLFHQMKALGDFVANRLMENDAIVSTYSLSQQHDKPVRTVW